MLWIFLAMIVRTVLSLATSHSGELLVKFQQNSRAHFIDYVVQLENKY